MTEFVGAEPQNFLMGVFVGQMKGFFYFFFYGVVSLFRLTDVQ